MYNHIHIVAFNVPYPPNYGGVIDVFYKIKALAKWGVNIHLHTYQYGRASAEELEPYCEKVYYYKRNVFANPFGGRLPYIIKSRSAPKLKERLMADDAPVLYEGLHTCAFLEDLAKIGKPQFVRMHNIEHLYYHNLAKVESNPFKKLFFEQEAKKLRHFQRKMTKASGIAAISPADNSYLRVKFDNTFYLPVFHQNEKVHHATEEGDFALYHGNLGVGENNEAALFLVNEVFSQLKTPFIIAGMTPSVKLQKSVAEHSHIRLKENLDTYSITKLVRNARINIMPTFQDTGIKLKLINVLFNGKHCLVNEKMVKNTGLEKLCHIANDAEEMKAAVRDLMEKPYSLQDYEDRVGVMTQAFNNLKNAGILVEKLKLKHQVPKALQPELSQEEV